jgi:glycosyltransferase involved in cell wall biosynthesis
MPKVSVILTSFNHEKYLREAIESVLNQSFTDFELIIWDDGSSDHSWEIICAYNDARIKAFRNEQSLRGNINRGLKVAKGDYIAIHHSDDVWKLDKLQQQVDFLDSHSEIGAVFSDIIAIGENSRPLNDPTHFYSAIFRQPNRSRYEWLNYFFYQGNALCHPSILIRKKCYEECGEYRPELAQLPDFDMWIRLCLKYEIHVLPDKLVRFRVRANEANTSGSRPETRIRSFTEYHHLLKNFLQITTFQEMVAVFPQANQYYRDEGFEPEFVLAMAALTANSQQFVQLFCIELLFNLMSDPTKAQKIKSLYGFDYRDFTAITAKYDVFSFEAVAELNQSVLELKHSIANHKRLLAERNDLINNLNNTIVNLNNTILEIYQSNSWRLTRPLRALSRLASREKLFLLLRLMRNIYSAVCSEISRHGFLGFFRRTPYYFYNFRIYITFLASRPPTASNNLFNKKFPVPRNIRLHPNLTGICDPIDASVSIVIPTLNAGLEFPLLLRKLHTQQGFRELEIVIVDSGSQDGTVEIARAAGCNVIEIPPTDFSHSYARNTGADAATGDYLLFMVQDAYPIGDCWIYGMLSYLLEHADEKLAAASCAEYSRSDSDIMYDSIVNTHYRFLGCLDYDRIGDYQGDDHVSLRSFGQLSDVSCLISSEVFTRYHYRGDYAEDLDLGIRLIKDNYRVAMLASVKVIHSHNRSSHYYLKRSFVDVIFLVRMFDDFIYPHIESTRGLIAGIVSVAAHLSKWLESYDNANRKGLLHDELKEWIKIWKNNFEELHLDKSSQLGNAALDAYINSLAERYLFLDQGMLDKNEQYEMKRFLNAFFMRLEHLNAFIRNVYGEQDTSLRKDLKEAVLKTFAATAGSSLAFMCLDFAQSSGTNAEMAKTITNELKAGI